MLKGAIARRYAGAIFDIARKQNTIDRTLEDVEKIADLFSKRKLAYLLRDRFTRGSDLSSAAYVAQPRPARRPARAG